MFNKMLTSMPLKDVKINDSYWNRYIKLVSDVVIPYQWDILNGRVSDAAPSYCLENYKIAAGEKSGEHQGVVFQDSDISKWLEAVAYSLESNKNPDLEKKCDDVISLIEKAQCDDGYLNTYFSIKENGRRWINLTEGHELYCAGHFIEAAVAYYDATGKSKILNIAIKFSDLICKVFGKEKNQIHGYPGHQEIELALVKLYRITQKEEYLKTAKYFIDERGTNPNYFLNEMKCPDFKHIFPEFNGYDPVYSQSHKPVREQTEADGHAVRAVYMYCAMADIAYETKDEELLKQCDILWNNIVNKRMYITGSIGSSGYLERFTTDYDLPNDTNYSETCASIGLALFGLRMAKIKRDASYMDVVEKALYNTLRSGISLEGNKYFYVNPLEVWPENCINNTSRAHVKPVRQKWFDVACCPTNIARTLTSFAQYIYAKDDNSIFVNLFVQNDTSMELNGVRTYLSLKTDFPKTGNIKINIKAEMQNEFLIYLRIPNYSNNYKVYVDGKEIEYQKQNGYAVISKAWADNTVTIKFDIESKIVRANPKVRADCGKVAIVRGPEVFCLEECDNLKGIAQIFIDSNTELKENWDDELFGGTTVISFEAKKYIDSGWNNTLYSDKKPEFEKITVKAIPYGYWNNRTPGEMVVWLHVLE